MSAYRLFGTETSPYSLKVRSFLRYKNAEFDWVLRSKETDAAFREHTDKPTAPLLIMPNGKASQNASNMLVTLEKAHGEPSARPDSAALAALALLLEDYADTWLNKVMVFRRWSEAPNQEAAAGRVLEQLLAGQRPAKRREAKAAIIERMGSHLPLVGAATENGPVLNASFERFARLFNTHLEKHLYIFGGRPSVADFAIAAQLQQMLTDPAPGEWLREHTPFITAWCEFMEAPKAGAPFAILEDVVDTLLPLLRDEVAITFLPWAEANSKTLSARKRDVSLDLADGAYAQPLQRSAVKSWREVKKTLQKATKNAPELLDLLKSAGFTEVL